MFADALSWLGSIGSVWFWLLSAGIAVVLLIWLLVEMADRRDERRAQEEADAEARIAGFPARKPSEADIIANLLQKAGDKKVEPVAPVADEIIRRLRKRDARTTQPTRAKKPNSRRKVARHK